MTDRDQPTPAVESLRTENGISVDIVDMGATIQSISLPVLNGRLNVVLAYPDPREYLTDPYFLGSTIGPVANRIRNAAFTLNDSLYRLDANDADRGNCLHGGTNGLHRQKFSLERDDCNSRIRCKIDVAHGVGGFPGNRSFEVVYELLDDWSLAFDFVATTDQDTVVNLANHAYFNLGGPLDDHQLRVFAGSYTPVDGSMIPTGERRDVRGSAYDFRDLQPLGNRRIDRNFVLRHSHDRPRLAAELLSNETGLQLKVLTTQPAMQVYTGDYLAEPFQPRQGICLEAQGFPDAPNQPDFPSAHLPAGATYRQRTIYRFSLADSTPAP